MDAESILMDLWKFIAHRGTPTKLFLDQGTNFRRGEKEFQEACVSLSSRLQQSLTKEKIAFHLNSPVAPHFGGAWEREICSVKQAVYTTVGAQAQTEELLRKVLVEVEGLLNSSPLGY